MAIIVVLNKENLATLQNTDTQLVALNQAAIIQISHTQQDIASMLRSGNKLIVTLNNGEKITLEQFFNADGSSPHQLVLPTQNGQFEVVEFDGKAKVINYNPIQHLTELATSQTWLNTQPTTVTAEAPVQQEAWYQKSWVKPALVVLGIEAVYLTAFDNDDDNKTNQAPDTTAPNAPTAVLDSTAKVISGQAEAGAKVYAQDALGNKLAEGVVNSKGEYTLNLTQALTDGAQLLVYVKDAAGNQSLPKVVTGTQDTKAPSIPEAQFNDSGSIVSGRAEAGTKVSLYSADGKTLLAGPVTAASDGSFSLTVNPPLATGSEAKVIVQDAAGHQSPSAQVIVGQDTLPPGKPTLEVNSTGSNVKGYSEANSIIEVKNDQGQVLATTTANGQGYFELVLNPVVTADSTTTIIVKDSAGNSAAAIILKPNLDTFAPEVIKADVNEEGTVLTGTAEANSKIKITIISNGQEMTIGSGQADSTGKFSINLNNPLMNNNSANVYAIDAAGNQSTATQVIGTKDTLAPSKISLGTMTVADDVGEQKGNISQNMQTDDARPKFDGRGEANATLTIYDHGIALTTVKVKSDGTWTYTPDQDLSLGAHSFSFSQMDSSGNTSPMSDSFKFTVGAVTAPENEVSATDTVDLRALELDEAEFSPVYESLTIVSRHTEAQTVESILAALLGEAESPVTQATVAQPLLAQQNWLVDDNLLQVQSYI